MTDTRDLEPKKVVRESYNRISRAYRGNAISRDGGYFWWLAMLTPLLQPGDPSSILAVAVAFRSPRSLPARFVSLASISLRSKSPAPRLSCRRQHCCAKISWRSDEPDGDVVSLSRHRLS
jgi:hypothetical protein